MTKHDAIWSQAFCELMISCQHLECSTLFEPTIRHPATDPVDMWSTTFAEQARIVGWKVDADGLVKCPAHSL